MELRDYAAQILLSEPLALKLAPPPGELSDQDPHLCTPPPRAPTRPPGLQIVRAVRVPAVEGMHDPAQRLRILHAFANHELQAVELFAWALLAFPDTPTAFRRGLLGLIRDEQRHFSLYQSRLEACGGAFGDQPVNGYFWNKAQGIETPIEFICAMGLTFESANLDHALDAEHAATAAGDRETAAVLRRVHDDEVGHVAFAWHWLGRFAPEEEPLGLYARSLRYPLRAAKAKGHTFYPASRVAAGLPEAFIQLLRDAH